VTYFWGVKDDLALDGESLVFTPAVDPFNDSSTRGAQLVTHVEAILAATGHAQVNLVGHSQGGLDARVVAHERPELVASVMTIATPHAGTSLADTLVGVGKSPSLSALVDAAVRLVGAPLYDAVGDETSVMASFRQLGTAGMAEFNETYPHPSGIPTWSIAGRTDLHRGGDDCRAAAPAFISRWDDERDPVDALLSVSEALLDGSVLDPVPNDGLVRVADSRWGTFLGCIPADHLDQMGQLFGDDPGLLNDFDHRAFYRALVRWLRSQGL
jgi:triacylglycerol lipase